MWCVPDLTLEFIERMEDILDLYEKPYDEAEPVFCLDEKPIARGHAVEGLVRSGDHAFADPLE